MGDRCRGHCCKAFCLSVPLEDIRLSAEAEKRGETEYVRTNGTMGLLLEDAAICAPIFVLLGEFKMNPYTGTKFDYLTPLYTCKELKENGDCGIYDSRPKVCRDYPHGRPCDFPECQWDEAKNPVDVAEKHCIE